MKKTSLLLSFALVLLAFAFILNNCGSSSGTDDKRTDPPNTKTQITGKVRDSNANALGGVKVSAGGKTTTCDSQGKFSLEVSPTDRLVVNFSKDGYVPASKITKMPSGVSIYLEPTVSQYETTETISAASGGVVYSNSDGGVYIPPGSLVDSSGNTYSGQATINITEFDPTTDTGLNAFPGEFKGVTTSGETVAIESFGFSDITITDNNGNPLQIAPGELAEMAIPIAPSLISSAPDTIPLWYYDNDTGKWYEDGFAEKFGDVYAGEVTHFTPWNIDRRIAYFCWISGRVVDSNGNPIKGATIIIRGTAGGVWSAGDVTGDDGTFLIRVPANRQATIQVSANGVSSEPQFITTCFTDDTNNLPDIVFDGGNTSVTENVSITLQNTSNENIHILIPGEDFETSNKLTPGSSRSVTVKSGLDQAVQFRAGRNGSVLTSVSCTYAGDPRDHSVIYSGSSTLTCGDYWKPSGGGTGEDIDNDGHNSIASGGDDCDDTDPNRFPDNPEVPNDGIDQDCDGEDLITECELRYTIYGQYGTSDGSTVTLSGDPVYPNISWTIDSLGVVNASEIEIISRWDSATYYHLLGDISSGIQYGDYTQPNTARGPYAYDEPESINQGIYEYDLYLKIPDGNGTVRDYVFTFEMYGFKDPTCKQ